MIFRKGHFEVARHNIINRIEKADFNLTAAFFVFKVFSSDIPYRIICRIIQRLYTNRAKAINKYI